MIKGVKQQKRKLHRQVVRVANGEFNTQNAKGRPYGEEKGDNEKSMVRLHRLEETSMVVREKICQQQNSRFEKKNREMRVCSSLDLRKRNKS